MAHFHTTERLQASDYDLSRCAYKLQESDLFINHADYIRRQFVQCLIEVCCNQTTRYAYANGIGR